MKKKLFKIVMYASAPLVIHNALAANTSTTLQVKVHVEASCVLNTDINQNSTGTALLDFSSITDLTKNISANTSTTSQGGLSVLCSPGTSWSLLFDGGTTALSGKSQSTSQRMMTDANGHYINYNLYSDASHNTPIPISQSISSDKFNISASSANNVPKIIPIYGVIPLDNTIPYPGNYSDAVTVTVVY